MTTIWHQDSESILKTVNRAMPHMDANESIFFARQLEYIVPQLYEIKYAQLKARTHFPVSFEGGPGIESITYRAFDRRGKAKIVKNYSTDFPRVNILAREVSTKVKSLGDSYGYDIQEIRSAQYAGVDLATQDAYAARMAIAEEENRIAYAGDPDSGLHGMANHPLVPISYAAYDITSDSTTREQISAVFRQAVLSVFETSRGIENPNMILVPLTVWTYLQTRSTGSNNDVPLIEWLKKIFPNVMFDWSNECTGAGPLGEDVMFAYVRDEQHLKLRIPYEFEQLPMFSDGATFTVKCHERFGGLQIIYPASCLLTILQ